MKLIKENLKGQTYQLNDYKICYRNKNSISWDNKINKKETIYLISWSAEFTIDTETKKITAPEKIEFPAKTYHKIKAITDICFLLYNY